MALAESTVNPWTSSQEDAMHNSVLVLLPREPQASFCNAYNGKAMAFLMNSLAELYPAISNIGTQLFQILVDAAKWFKSHTFFEPLKHQNHN